MRAAPSEKPGRNRWALTDGDGDFDTDARKSERTFSLADTAGCSCEQIIERLSLGKGHTKRGCSTGVMKRWVANQ